MIWVQSTGPTWQKERANSCKLVFDHHMFAHPYPQINTKIYLLMVMWPLAIHFTCHVLIPLSNYKTPTDLPFCDVLLWSNISIMCPRTQGRYTLAFQHHIVLKSKNLVCMANRNLSDCNGSSVLSYGEKLTNHCTEESKINTSNTSRSGSIFSPVCYGD